MRPSDNERCAVCVETMQPKCDAADFGPAYAGRTHLQFMYDKRVLSHCAGMTEAQITTHLRDYALNRMLAPFRDNLNKKRGERAKTEYQSRNTRGASILAKIKAQRGR